MLYQLEHGKTEQHAIRQFQMFGEPIPDVYLNRPTLWIGLDIYLEAFWHLCTCRSIGMSVGPIPWTACEKYARINQFDDDQADDLIYHVGRMDQAYLEWLESSRPKGKS